MTHPNEDRLLLFAYDELPSGEAGELTAHLAACPVCRAGLERLSRGLVAIELAAPRRFYTLRWAALALAAAAVLAAVMLTSRPVGDVPKGGAWELELRLSATAGYVAGGPALIAIDSQLTRLEQEPSYVRP